MGARVVKRVWTWYQSSVEDGVPYSAVDNSVLFAILSGARTLEVSRSYRSEEIGQLRYVMQLS